MTFVETFLFCIELKYGLIIIGFVDMILSAILGSYLPWIRRKADDDLGLLTEEPQTARITNSKIISEYRFYTGADFYFNRFGYSMFIFCVVVLTLHIGSCILLICSAISDTKWMSAPYVATALMRFVVLLLILIWIVTKSFDCTTSFWLIGLSLFPATYFWLSVVSWYQPVE
ncbi:uncharacterized protein LOC108111968 [Drosophila eugracilis]|uniref:uncharacterized protein LOC108111968 n=1 Tax=Drosophila eugracilis TaxID=29029 RepID=UPI0007E8AE65|nr:uncharacterized protein LOC108111968 [Drosophila eugracilis]